MNSIYHPVDIDALRNLGYVPAPMRLSRLFAILIAVTSVHADPSPFRSECTQNHLIAFHIDASIRNFSTLSGQNLCTQTQPLPPQITGLLTSVGKVIGDVSNALGTTADQAFSGGIDLTLTHWDSGPLDEGASGNQVTISQFADWNGESIDLGGLAHELGHVLADTAPVGTYIHDLRSLWIMTEGFADLIAFNTYGHVFDRTNDLAVAINNAANRDLSTPVSYNQTMSFFLETGIFEAEKLVCKSLTPAELANAHNASLCSWFQSESQDSGYVMTLPKATDPFSASECIALDDPHWYGWGCDMHQLPLPFTTFLVSLGAVQKTIQLLLAPLAPQRPFQCHYDSDLGKLHPIAVKRSVIEDFLKTLESQISPTQQISWSTQWAANDLDQIFAMSHFNLSKSLAALAYVQIQAFESGQVQDSFYNQANSCFGKDDPGYVDQTPGCTVTCDL